MPPPSIDRMRTVPAIPPLLPCASPRRSSVPPLLPAVNRTHYGWPRGWAISVGAGVGFSLWGFKILVARADILVAESPPRVPPSVESASCQPAEERTRWADDTGTNGFSTTRMRRRVNSGGDAGSGRVRGTAVPACRTAQARGNVGGEAAEVLSSGRARGGSGRVGDRRGWLRVTADRRIHRPWDRACPAGDAAHR